MADKKYHSAFDNLNTLNDIILDKAHSMLNQLNGETDELVRNTIQSKKPEHLKHLTDEEWEKHKELGRRILNLKHKPPKP